MRCIQAVYEPNEITSASAAADTKSAAALTVSSASDIAMFGLSSQSVWRVFNLFGYERSIEIGKHKTAATALHTALTQSTASNTGVAELFRTVLTQRVLIRILDILSTNAQGLSFDGSGTDGVGGGWRGASGSGLFLRAAMIEHSCIPNACYTPLPETPASSTSGGADGKTSLTTTASQSGGAEPITSIRITVQAIDAISAGSPIAICYSGSYEPLKLRRSHLKYVYGFDCECRYCRDSPDLCRAFVIPFDACSNAKCNAESAADETGTATANGKIICPAAASSTSTSGSSGSGGSGWVCMRCRQPFTTESIITACGELEASLKSLPPLQRNLNQLLLSPSKQSKTLVSFHESHHLLFEALDQQVAICCEKNQPSLAEVLAGRLVLSADRVLQPKYNPERATYYDVLAQTRIAQQTTPAPPPPATVTDKKLQLAAIVYARLYDMMKVIRGASHPTALRYRAWALRPPTFQELLNFEKSN